MSETSSGVLNKDTTIKQLQDEIAQLKEQISLLPQFDTLTLLPNITLFEDRLKQGMARARRTQRLMAIMYLDIDNIKAVVDQYGEPATHELLKDFAARFKTALREADTLARIGPDTYGAVLEEVKKPNDVPNILKKIRDNIAVGFYVDGKELKVTASIGVAYYDGGDQSHSEVMAAANHALIEAKIAGRNTYIIAESLAGT